MNIVVMKTADGGLVIETETANKHDRSLTLACPTRGGILFFTATAPAFRKAGVVSQPSAVAHLFGWVAGEEEFPEESVTIGSK